MEKQRSLKEKLGFFEILKEVMKIPFKNPNLIIFTCFTSLPLFFSLLMYENMFMQSIIEAVKVLQEDTESYYCKFCYLWKSMMIVDHLINKVSHNFFVLVLSHTGIIHLCDLLNTIATVNSSSSIICRGEESFTLEEMFSKNLMDSRIKGPLITSIYTLLLTSILSAGMISLVMYIYIVNTSPFFMVLFFAMFVVLLRQYLEWSAVWEMGTVISVLEEKEGDVALVVAAYLSRGNRGIGILLMIGCFLWRFFLRLVCLFIAWNFGGSKMLIMITVIQVCLVCLGNIVMWIFFVVYYTYCKKMRLETEESVV